jgi:hypothetical protein
MRFSIALALVGGWAVASACAATRINQEGRILGDVPVVTQSILFNTPTADAVVGAMQIFPVTSAWNEDISRRPLLANSAAMISQITNDLSTSRQTLRPFFEMNFVLVPDNQSPMPIVFVDYPDESDPGPYPIPSNMPIETWPLGTGSQTLMQWQQDVSNIGGDRHAILVQPGTGLIREMWQAKLVGANWEASNGAKFDLNSNNLRPAGWTSGDAAGLPMFPALVRYDECQRGMVEHAMRLVVKRTRKEYLYPATHYASTTAASQTNVPAMGQRLRLKSNFSIPSQWTREEKAVLLAFKKYGAIVADNGNFFSISVTPDDRWPAGAFDHLSTIGITNFEVIQTTGPTAGPRSPGGPVSHAGGNQAVSAGAPANLRGYVSFSVAPPEVQWRAYSGPGTVTFDNSSQTNTTATFSAPGVYTLLLSADDGVHAVSYDAAVVTVGLTVSAARFGTNLNLSWTGPSSAYVVEQTAGIPTLWSPALTTSAQFVTFPIMNSNGFFRIRSQ